MTSGIVLSVEQIEEGFASGALSGIEAIHGLFPHLIAGDVDAVIESLSPNLRALVQGYARNQLPIYERLFDEARGRGEPDEPLRALRDWATRHPIGAPIMPLDDIIAAWKADETFDARRHIVLHLREGNIDAIFGRLPPKLRRSMTRFASRHAGVYDDLIAAARRTGAPAEPWIALQSWLACLACIEEDAEPMSVEHIVDEWRQHGKSSREAFEALLPHFRGEGVEAVLAQLPPPLRSYVERDARRRLPLLDEEIVKGDARVVESLRAVRTWAIQHPIDEDERGPVEDTVESWQLGAIGEETAIQRLIQELREDNVEDVTAALPARLGDALVRYARAHRQLYDELIASAEARGAPIEPWLALKHIVEA